MEPNILRSGIRLGPMVSPNHVGTVEVVGKVYLLEMCNRTAFDGSAEILTSKGERSRRWNMRHSEERGKQ